MAVTLKDVALKCGLSASTVSDVLNHRSRTWASEETRRRVFAVADAMGYRPHSAARALRTGKTYVVTFVYHRDWMHLPVTYDGAAEIMAAQLGEQGYDLKLHVYPNQVQLMDGLSELVRRNSCDAIVLFGRESHVAEQGRFLAQHKIPFVVKGRHEREYPDWYQVDYDHEGMMRSVVAHLAEQGHRRIAYIGHPPTEVYQNRLEDGFKAAYLAQFGQAAPAECICSQSWHGENAIDAAMARWDTLPADKRPTALAIGTGDREWYMLERCLARRRRSIGYGPSQVAVSGQATPNLHLAFGQGHYFADISHASIAAVAVNDLLVPLLTGRKPESPIRRILPPLQTTQSLNLPLYGA